MKLLRAIVLYLGLFGSAAFSQGLNPAVADYSPDAFKNCYDGSDIGKRFGVSNPSLLLGSISYLGPVMGDNAAITIGWVREPLSLPITITEAVDPDVTTCNLEFEATAGGGFSVLGVGINAQRSDVFRVAVRLISRQQLSQVAAGGIQTRVWNASAYANQFRAAIGNAPSTIDNFFLFDNISVYLVQIERFRRESVGITGGIGLFTGGASYKRDDTFKGIRLFVAGDPVVLPRTRFRVSQTVVANQASQQATNTTIAEPLPGGILNDVRTSLTSASKGSD